MKINDYPEITDLSQGDKLVVETPDGTKKIDGSNVIKVADPVTLDSAVLHRNTFRGKNIGTEFTDDQKEAIQSGTFDDLYVGDYWVMDGYHWRIMDINCFKEPKSYFGICDNNNHLVIMTDEYLYKDTESGPFGANVGGVNTSTLDVYKTGYSGSRIYTIDNTICKNKFQNSFGEDSLLTFKTTVPSAISDSGIITATSLLETKCFSPKLPNIFGGISSSQPTTMASAINNYNSTVGQFSAFIHKPSLIMISNGNEQATGNQIQYSSTYLSSDFGGKPGTCLLIGSYLGITASYGEKNMQYRPYACIG